MMCVCTPLSLYPFFFLSSFACFCSRRPLKGGNAPTQAPCLLPLVQTVSRHVVRSLTTRVPQRTVTLPRLSLCNRRNPPFLPLPQHQQLPTRVRVRVRVRVWVRVWVYFSFLLFLSMWKPEHEHTHTHTHNTTHTTHNTHTHTHTHTTHTHTHRCVAPPPSHTQPSTPISFTVQ